MWINRLLKEDQEDGPFPFSNVNTEHFFVVSNLIQMYDRDKRQQKCG